MEEINDLLMIFKKGIESGDESIREGLIAKNVGPLSKAVSLMFPQLCQMLQTQYQGKEFPMKVEKIKIRQNGKAKAATLVTEEEERIVFTFIQENGKWRISHFEGILFPLFDLPDTPYHDVLKLEDRIRGWVSAENELAFMSKVYKELENQSNRENAVKFFLDGAGYKIAMDAWLPFIEGPAQYILYTAVIETNLRGSMCTVTEISEDHAKLEMRPMAHLEVLKRAVFNPKLSYSEFEDLYSVVTQDRARHSNLDISLEFDDTNCTIIAKR